jgi:PPOX class probable F420-dependent enzyme
MMEEMTQREYLQFLTEKPRTGKAATVKADGSPHVVPIWFTLDGETLVFTTWHATVKAANLRRDNRIAICVDDQQPPFSFIQIEGRASLQEDAEDLEYWATRIAGRYMGEQKAEEYGRRNSVHGELLVRVKPIRVIARKNIAD